MMAYILKENRIWGSLFQQGVCYDHYKTAF